MFEQAKNIIQRFFDESGFNGQVSFECEERTGTLWCAVTTPDAHYFTSGGGEALNALNHIIKRIVEKEVGEGIELPIIVDISNLKKKHIENLRATAHMVAERARFFKSSVDVEPMSAFDRRVIHEFLSEHSDIKTDSTGEGKDRHIVVKYVGGGF